MRLSSQGLLRAAEAAGFQPELYEKVLQLLDLLERIVAQPFLQSRLALKGGTALNVFAFDVPRLSVDLDLNYVGSADRDVMQTERPKLQNLLAQLCQRAGFSIRRSPTAHAGGKLSLRFDSAVTPAGNLSLDINYLHRQPLWPTTLMYSRLAGSAQVRGVPVLDLHDIMGGKLAALLARRAARDLFDAHHALTCCDLDPERLRLAFVVYGAASRRDWRSVTLEDVDCSSEELAQQLVPVLHTGVRPKGVELETWRRRLIDECRQALAVVLPLRAPERAFLDRLIDHGQVEPSLLTADSDLQDRIRLNPPIQWKARNVRAHLGLDVAPEDEPSEA